MGAKVKWYRDAWWVIVHHAGKKNKRKVGPLKDDLKPGLSAAARKLVMDRAHQQAVQLAVDIDKALLSGGQLVLPDAPKPEPKVKETAPEPFNAAAEKWLKVKVWDPARPGKGKSRLTYETYRNFVHNHMIPYFGAKPVQEITSGDVQRFYEHMLQKPVVKNRSKRTKPEDRTLVPRDERNVRKACRVLGAVLQLAVRHEIISTNPVTTWLGTDKYEGKTSDEKGSKQIDESKVLNSEELARLLRVAHEEFREIFPIVALLAHTGCRIGEACGLNWEHVDLENGRVHIKQSHSGGRVMKSTKTGKERFVELSPTVVQALREIRPDIVKEGTPVFLSPRGERLNQINFRLRSWDRLIRKALGRHFTPHGLRHTFATQLLARGTSIKTVQLAGGWASATMVLDVYGHALPEESKGYANVLPALDGPQTALTPEIDPRRSSSVLTVNDKNRRMDGTLSAQLRSVGER